MSDKRTDEPSVQEDTDSDIEKQGTKNSRIDTSYKDANYWALPENVRNAIDVAKMKSKHSAFYYRLQTLNDKIFIFRHMYYDKMPSF